VSTHRSIVRWIAFAAAVVSACAWTYRSLVEHVHLRVAEIAVYAAVPTLTWALFAGPLLLTTHERRWVRIVAIILLVPIVMLWVVSILVGIKGLRIH
jgi:hypothetical protein